MPRVPEFSERRVQLRGLSTRGVGTRSSPDDFGAGIGEALQQVGGQAGRIEEQRLRKQRETLVQEYGVAASQFDTEKILGEALQTKGKEAFGVEQHYLDEFDRWHGSFIKDKSPEQQAMLETVAAKRRDLIRRQLLQHRFTQEEVYQQETAKAYQEQNMLEVSAYYMDPERVNTAIGNTVSSIRANSEGKDKAVVDLEVAKAKSKARYTVLSQMVMAKRPASQVKEYMERYQSELAAGGDLDNAQTIVQEYTATSEAQELTDSIMASHDNLQDALAAARNLEGEQRDAVTTRVKQRFAEEEAARNQLKQQTYDEAQRIVEESGDISGISPEMKMNLDSSQLHALETRARQVRDLQISGLEPVTDRTKFSKWIAQSIEDPDGFAEIDPYETFRQHADDADYQKLLSLQASIKSGRSGDLNTTMTVDFNERVATAARRSGVIGWDDKVSGLNSSKMKRYTAFRDRIALRIEEFEREQLGGKRKATGAEQQKIVNEALAETVTVPQSFAGIDYLWKDSEVPAAALQPDEAGRAIVPMSELDDRDRESLATLAQAYGYSGNLDDDTMQRLAAAVLLGDEQLQRDILSGAN